MMTLRKTATVTGSSTRRQRILPRVLIAVLALSPIALRAQSQKTTISAQPIDLAITFAAQNSIRVADSQKFWLEGGSAEIGIAIARGFGVAVDFTGGHTSSIGSSGVPLTLTIESAGPRYRMNSRGRWSPYAEVLFGGATGSDSIFPAASGMTTSASSFALQARGGLDYRCGRYVAVRALDVGYLRTTLPNAAGNAQNLLQLGAGVVFRFGGSPKR